MRDQIVRIILLCFLLLIVTSDIQDLMNSPTMYSLSNWFGRMHPDINKGKALKSSEMSNVAGSKHSPSGASSKWIQEQVQNNPELRMELANLEKEKQQLIALKSRWNAVMQQYCLPKLICELHAAVTDGFSMSDAERGLLSLIKDTSLGTAGEIVSRYHFAAHMGQLLSGVEGNGCHNFYPNCPMSGTRVLQMVRKVRV